MYIHIFLHIKLHAYDIYVYIYVIKLGFIRMGPSQSNMTYIKNML